MIYKSALYSALLKEPTGLPDSFKAIIEFLVLYFIVFLDILFGVKNKEKESY